VAGGLHSVYCLLPCGAARYGLLSRNQRNLHPTKHLSTSYAYTYIIQSARLRLIIKLKESDNSANVTSSSAASPAVNGRHVDVAPPYTCTRFTVWAKLNGANFYVCL